MENGAISDGQITASSRWNDYHEAPVARLHLQTDESKKKAGAWAAGVNAANQWLQVDLGDQYTNITRVATQGRHAVDQWVSKYKLQYSDDGVTFQYYKEQGQTKVKYISSTVAWFDMNSLNGNGLGRVFLFLQLSYVRQSLALQGYSSTESFFKTIKEEDIKWVLVGRANQNKFLAIFFKAQFQKVKSYKGTSPFLKIQFICTLLIRNNRRQLIVSVY